MQFTPGICQLSVIPLRALPSHTSEMISQIIFGELVQVIDRDNHWIKVMTEDGYLGFAQEIQINYIDFEMYTAIEKNKSFITREVNLRLLKGALKEPLYIPMGSSLPFYDEGKCTIDQQFYQVTSSNIFIPNSEEFQTDVEETARMFLNVPYLWGGRTHFGIDCSGFTQMVFRMLGISIKRDAWQQAEEGQLVNFLSEANTGDLAFFDNQEGKITHVGIMLNNSQIIHASGRVKIDRIDNQGIFSASQNKYTHQLRIVKRYVG